MIPSPGAAQSAERALHVSECTIDASGDDGAAVWLIRRLGRASADGHLLPLEVNAGSWAAWTFEMSIPKEFLDARGPVAGEAAQLYDRAAVGPAAAPSCAGARVRRGEQFTVLCLNAAGGDAPGAGPRQHCTWDVDVAFE